MTLRTFRPTSLGAVTAGVLLVFSFSASAAPKKKRAAAIPAVKIRVAPPAVQEALRDEVVVEERSSEFTPARVSRQSPFWPVGWMPGMKKVEAPPTTKIVPSEIFSISSIMLGPPDLAVINGKRYESGQDIPVALPDKTINFRIVQIRDGAVVMQYGQQRFAVAQRGRNPDLGGPGKPAQ